MDSEPLLSTVKETDWSCTRYPMLDAALHEDRGKPENVILVTGASGLVGNNLVRHLLSLGRTVRVLVREQNNESLRGLNIETFVGDVLRPDSLRLAMCDVATVFHLAAAISIDGQHDSKMRRVNIEGTANVVAACLTAKVKRLVHFSSVHAFSFLPKSRPIDEQREPALDPKTHLAYDRSKAEGEQAVMLGVQKGLSAVILNPVGIFGPHDYEPSPTGEFLSQLTRRSLPGLVRGGYYWVDVRDVAAAAVAAEAQGRSGEKYILCGEYATFKMIARIVYEVSGARPPLFNIPLWMAKIVAPGVVWYSRRLGIRPLVTPEAIQIIDCHQTIRTVKAVDELDFRPRPFRETVVDSVRWLRNRVSS